MSHQESEHVQRIENPTDAALRELLALIKEREPDWGEEEITDDLLIYPNGTLPHFQNEWRRLLESASQQIVALNLEESSYPAEAVLLQYLTNQLTELIVKTRAKKEDRGRCSTLTVHLLPKNIKLTSVGIVTAKMMIQPISDTAFLLHVNATDMRSRDDASTATTDRRTRVEAVDYNVKCVVRVSPDSTKSPVIQYQPNSGTNRLDYIFESLALAPGSKPDIELTLGVLMRVAAARLKNQKVKPEVEENLPFIVDNAQLNLNTLSVATMNEQFLRKKAIFADVKEAAKNVIESHFRSYEPDLSDEEAENSNGTAWWFWLSLFSAILLTTESINNSDDQLLFSICEGLIGLTLAYHAWLQFNQNNSTTE